MSPLDIVLLAVIPVTISIVLASAVVICLEHESD